MTDSQSSTGTQAIPWQQVFSWSVRRELWENKSIYIAPLSAAILMVVGFLFALRHFAYSQRAFGDSMSQDQMVSLAEPFSHAAWLLMLTALVVGVVYSLGALHGERSDRSILFWKSLPVADLMTVLAKASIPFVVLPAISIGLGIALQLVLLLLGSAAMTAAGLHASALWQALPWLQVELTFLYTFVVILLWLAPVYAWCLLVSGWARRSVFLWAALPPVGLCILERIAFGTPFVWAFLKDRFAGFVFRAFDVALIRQSNVHMLHFSQATPGRFLATPALWLGLATTAIMLFAAARQRRLREPI